MIEYGNARLYYAHRICARFYVQLREERIWWEAWGRTFLFWRRRRMWSLFYRAHIAGVFCYTVKDIL